MTAPATPPSALLPKRRLRLVRTLSPYAAAQTITALNRPVQFIRVGKAVIAWSGRSTDFSREAGQ